MNDAELARLIEPAVTALGLELVGVERALARGGGLVRVYIDAPGRAVTLDDCEAASREMSALLDLGDPIAGRYTLEVSSPGLERPLFTPAQFERHLGQQARLELSVPIAGRRRLQGRIAAVEGAEIVLELEGESVRVAHGNVARAQIKPDYAALFGGDTKRKPGAGKSRRRGNG